MQFIVDVTKMSPSLSGHLCVSDRLHNERIFRSMSVVVQGVVKWYLLDI